jgi:hypothetical protein
LNTYKDLLTQKVKVLRTSHNKVYVCFLQFEHCTQLKNVGTDVQEGHLPRMVPAIFSAIFRRCGNYSAKRKKGQSPLKPNRESYTWLLSDTVKS